MDAILHERGGRGGEELRVAYAARGVSVERAEHGSQLGRVCQHVLHHGRGGRGRPRVLRPQGRVQAGAQGVLQLLAVDASVAVLVHPHEGLRELVELLPREVDGREGRRRPLQHVLPPEADDVHRDRGRQEHRRFRRLPRHLQPRVPQGLLSGQTLRGVQPEQGPDEILALRGQTITKSSAKVLGLPLGERHLQPQQGVGQYANAPHIATVCSPVRLELRCRVLRVDDVPPRIPSGRLHEARALPVGDHHSRLAVGRGVEHVLRPQVLVNDPLLVRVGHRRDDLVDAPRRAVLGHLAGLAV
mmetsp:Transcript_81433/g.252741  ORF Transcript_81433/g.252741 Transcript_81433/m.252741 type:complete len:301 (+) Transcript_81433:424-1326(+)